ncbi:MULTISPECIES: CAP domain-containing protein [unclassified Sphingomonas]|uniref:CAP domain-containing protein n=1 Tax=unclassified Sphingomonas TaxID=196159 RepID=UPI0009278EC6|nr:MULTISPECIES: CAP domain-containing protein [unclassified Sphingomonas]OJU19652.1 MAG: serine protease [Sphingomonas sp. 66-10]
MAAMPAKGHRAIALSLALTLLAACGGYAPARVVEPRLSEAPAPRGAALLRSVMLRGHNGARGALGLAPLAWDDSLADAARDYAGEMARTGRFAHAEQPQGMGRQGENLWMGTRDAYRYDEMLGHWLAERRDYVNLPTPGFSRTGRWQDVSHYSEIVWRGARRIGCAVASDRRNDFLVCRYSPPGNVVGETAY